MWSATPMTGPGEIRTVTASTGGHGHEAETTMGSVQAAAGYDGGVRGVGLLRAGVAREGRGIGLLRQRGIGLLSSRVAGMRSVGVKGIGLLSVATLAGSGLVAVAPAAYAGVLVTGSSSDAVATAIHAEGGSVVSALTVVNGVIANIRPEALAALRRRPGVSAVLVDAGGATEGLSTAGYNAPAEVGSMYTTARRLGADTEWDSDDTADGVGVAVIDSGVQPSPAFGARLEAGIDLTGANNALADGFGHGTHIAGIIAGHSGAVGSTKGFTGIAPDARIVSVRVADATGATSLLKILQGMDWVYKNAAARNIKVVNMSLGVPGYSDYRLDPLAAAAERLWASGVTVVASAGNVGAGHGLASPAYDPFVVAVGAVDTMGTLTTADDVPAAFSATAATAGGRGPDVVVPARSIQSLKAAGSTLALTAPATALVGTGFLKGSGTSQAAAEVSGLVALLYGADQSLTPDDLKAFLCKSADGPWSAGSQGCGVPSLQSSESPDSSHGHHQGWKSATTSGTTADPTSDGKTRQNTWQGSSWQGSSWQGSSWQGSSWQGSSWQGQSWQGTVG